MSNIKKVLIANRGEIALRVIRACKDLNIPTVAVHSQADEDSLHTLFADEDVCIGPASTKESYLNIPRIIAACEVSGANAVHPGYGFLSENATFADICSKNGITFIGPKSEVITRMGDKANARATMKAAGVPIIPGSDILKDVDDALKNARSIKYPVILKATAGGGGKGMRICRSDEDIKVNFPLASNEASVSFDNPNLYMEKYIENPRHIEVQILADNYGNTVYLGERDCSLQRRHQKLLEESPSPAVTSSMRKKMGEAAVRGAKSVGYSGAGTIEFLLDEDGSFYFMEMNTRIQVEHPVTEMVTGIDLIKMQLLVAMGEKLPMKQHEIEVKGHAIECRINAEDWENGFAPRPGTIERLHFPGGFGVRIDSHIYSGYKIPSNYDSMIAKVIVWGENRAEAIRRMYRVLDETMIIGIPTTVGFHQKMLTNQTMKDGQITTKFLENVDVKDL